MVSSAMGSSVGASSVAVVQAVNTMVTTNSSDKTYKIFFMLHFLLILEFCLEYDM
jgi:hypothetical protein